jgi:nitrogen fixation protein FixH
MKMNWGTGMAITMIAFMAFIIVLAVKMSNIETNLVEKDYYEKGQNFDKINEMKSNFIKKGDVLSIFDNETSYTFAFFSEMDSGYIHFYRPSSRKLDFKMNCASRSTIKVDVSTLLRGAWNVKVMVFKDGIGYLTEEAIEI